MHLGYTLGRCQGVLPHGVAALSRISEEHLERLDALAVRFARCQEFTGTTMRAEAILLGEAFEDYPKLLDALRKRGLRVSIGEWQVLRDLRNDVGHAYLGTDEEFFDFYREVLQHAPSLIESACRMYDHAVTDLGFAETELGARPV